MAAKKQFAALSSKATTAAKTFGDGKIIEALQKINWEKLFTMISGLLANCAVAGATRKAQEGQIRTPGKLMRARVTRHVKRDLKDRGMSTAQWNKQEPAIMDFVFSQGKNATPEDVKAILDGAEKVAESGVPDDDE